MVYKGFPYDSFSIKTVNTLVSLGFSSNLLNFISSNLDINPGCWRHDFVTDNLEQLAAYKEGYSNTDYRHAVLATMLLHISGWYNSDDYAYVSSHWLESLTDQPFSQEYYGIDCADIPPVVRIMRNYKNPITAVDKLVLAASHGSLDTTTTLRHLYLRARTINKLSVADSLEHAVTRFVNGYTSEGKVYKTLQAVNIELVTTRLQLCNLLAQERKKCIITVSSHIAKWEEFIKEILND